MDYEIIGTTEQQAREWLAERIGCNTTDDPMRDPARLWAYLLGDGILYDEHRGAFVLADDVDLIAEYDAMVDAGY